MSRTLSDLLSAIEPTFTLALRELEQVTGRPGIDIRLTAEIVGKIQLRIRELGLDPSDTTGKELYQALLFLTKSHDEFLARALGSVDPSNVEDVVKRVVKKVNELTNDQLVWAIKPTIARKLLKKMPPKKAMKQLGYKSIDSLLKREDIMQLYGAMRFMETPAWQEKFIQSYKHLTSSDFETRKLKILQLDSKRWQKMAHNFVLHNRHNITHLKEMGLIIVLPFPLAQLHGVCLITMLMLLHYANELKVYSTLFKFHQLKPDFGEIVVRTLLDDPNSAVVMGGQHLHWRVIQHYYGRNSEADHPEVFEPHVQPEDLSWRQAEDILYTIEPALKFWQDMDYVGAIQEDDRPLSFNLMDMAINYCNALSYEARVSHHMREALWNEIFIRYMGERKLERQILEYLEQGLEPVSKHTKHLLKGKI